LLFFRRRNFRVWVGVSFVIVVLLRREKYYKTFSRLFQKIFRLPQFPKNGKVARIAPLVTTSIWTQENSLAAPEISSFTSHVMKENIEKYENF
jgi:hypothetical protein